MQFNVIILFEISREPINQVSIIPPLGQGESSSLEDIDKLVVPSAFVKKKKKKKKKKMK